MEKEYIPPNEYKTCAQKGFTLVEVLVVLILMVLLFSVAAWGILEWQDFADNVGQEEKATMLFSALQQRIETRPVEGDFPQILLETLSGEGGRPYVADKVWPDSMGRVDIYGNDISEQYREPICYLKCDKGDYSKFAKGEAVSPEAALLFTWIEDFVADKSILNAAICVEFAPKSRQVFSVFYSTKYNSFVYSPGMGAGKGVADISDRSTTYLKQVKIGYYGVDTLYMRVE